MISTSNSLTEKERSRALSGEKESLSEASEMTESLSETSQMTEVDEVREMEVLMYQLVKFKYLL